MLPNKTESKHMGREFSKNTIFLLFGRIMTTGVKFIIGVGISRTYGVELYGKFDLALTIYTIGFILIVFQLDSAIIRFGTQAKFNAGELLVIALIFEIILSLFYFISLLIIFSLNILNLSLDYLFIVAGITSIPTAFFMVFSSYVVASNRFKGLAIILTLSSISLLILTFLLENLFNTPLLGFFLAQISSDILGCIIIFLYYKTSLSQFSLNFQHLKQLLRYSIPLLPNVLLGTIVVALPRIAINFYYGERLLGILGVAFVISIPFTLLNSSFQTIWAVRFLEGIEIHPDHSTKENWKFYNLFMSFGSFLYLVLLFISPIISLIYLKKIELLVVVFFSMIGIYYFIIGLHPFSLPGIWITKKTELFSIFNFIGVIITFILMNIIGARSSMALVSLLILDSLLVHILLRIHLFKTFPKIFSIFSLRSLWRMGSALAFFLYCLLLIHILEFSIFFIFGSLLIIISLIPTIVDYRKLNVQN